MVIESIEPSRIDLAGGRLDTYPLYLFEEGGITVNAAITGALLQLNGTELVSMAIVGCSANLEAQKVRVPTGKRGCCPACFGELLDEEWANRCRLAEGVTNERIERLIAATRDAGGVAGRVCGAGGG